MTTADKFFVHLLSHTNGKLIRNNFAFDLFLRKYYKLRLGKFFQAIQEVVSYITTL